VFIFRKLKAPGKILMAAALITSCTLGISSGKAFAFKVGTHVWVGQQVVNNLRNCQSESGASCVNITLQNPKANRFFEAIPANLADDMESMRLPVNREISEAIRDYPQYFRMGNIGPDAFPGIYEGQMLIHPGNLVDSRKVGFGTGQFINLLIQKAFLLPPGEDKKKALSFTYGFAAHAAADIFAHTYVNTYAGDIFTLIDGEQAVETRHMALESYIDKYRPELLDANNQPVGKVEDAVKDGRNLAIPVAFLRDTLIFGSEMQGEYKKQAGMSHLTAVAGLKKSLESLLCQAPSNMSNEELIRSVGSKVAQEYAPQLAAEGHSEGLSNEEITRLTTEDSEEGRAFRARMSSFIDSFKQSSQKSGGCAVQQIDTLALQIVAFAYLDVALSKREAQKILELKQELDEFMRKGANEILKASGKIDDANLKLAKFANTKTAESVNKAIDGLKEVLKLAGKLVELDGKRLDAEKRLNDALWDLQHKFNSFVCDGLNNVCSDDNFRKAKDVLENYACKVPGKVPGTCDVVEKINCSIFKQVPGFCTEKKCVGKGRLKTCANIHVPCMKDELVADLCEKTKQVSCMVDGLVESTCQRTTTVLVVDVAAQGVCLTNKATCQANEEAFKQGRRLIEEKIKLERSLMDGTIREIANVQGSLDEAKKSVKESMAAINDFLATTVEIKKSIDQNVTDLALRLNEGLRGIVQGWVNDIDLAMGEYILANGKSIVNTMDSDDSTGMLQPLLDWVSCRLPSIAGLPAPALGATVCAAHAARDSVEKLKKDLDGAMKRLTPPLIRMWQEKLEKEIAKLPYRIADQTHNQFQQIFGKTDTTPSFLLHAMEKDISNHDLDSIFGSDGTNKGLVEFEEMGSRMHDRALYDMGIADGGNHFDAKSFPAIHNAEKLATLTVLGTEGLNVLTQARIGRSLFVPGIDSNILSTSVASIDGNHQWMNLAPPYLRKGTIGRDGEWAHSRDNCQNYTRRFSLQTSENSSYGFKLFMDRNARKEIFERIFLGPIVPSLESSRFVNKKPADFPLAANEAEPFAGNFNFGQCGASTGNSDNASGNTDSNGHAPGNSSNAGGSPATQPLPPPHGETHASNTLVIYDGETFGFSQGQGWDTSSSTLESSTAAPYSGASHLRASLNNVDYWAAAAYVVDAWNPVNFAAYDTISFFAKADRPVRVKLMMVSTDNHLESAHLEFHATTSYQKFTFRVRDARKKPYDLSDVHVMVFAVSEPGEGTFLLDIDSISLSKDQFR
jgi:hypothetical protein